MVAIIKYNAGNTRSVQNALDKLGAESVITEDFSEISQASRVIFPGVGEASSAMKFLKNNGLAAQLPTLKIPFLGICLGQQLMCGKIEEGNTFGMNIFPAEVKKFPPEDLVPHMGWDNVSGMKNPLFTGISEDDNFYFVHSYFCEITGHTAARCDYIVPFSAAMMKDNFFAVQFHPEKSEHAGEKLLKNFLNIKS